MRVFADANIFISYLLTPDATSPPVQLTEAAISDAYTLLLTEQVMIELSSKTTTKPYLAQRITRSQTAELAAILRAVAEWVPALEPPFPAVGLDRKDDYLFAHAVLGQADYLVSGDGGVRSIDQIGNVQIVSPAECLEILKNKT